MAGCQRGYWHAILLATYQARPIAVERISRSSICCLYQNGLVRCIDDVLHTELASEAEVKSSLLNRVPGWSFALDIAIAPRPKPLFRVSLMTIAAKA